MRNLLRQQINTVLTDVHVGTNDGSIINTLEDANDVPIIEILGLGADVGSINNTKRTGPNDIRSIIKLPGARNDNDPELIIIKTPTGDDDGWIIVKAEAIQVASSDW